MPDKTVALLYQCTGPTNQRSLVFEDDETAIAFVRQKHYPNHVAISDFTAVKLLDVRVDGYNQQYEVRTIPIVTRQDLEDAKD